MVMRCPKIATKSECGKSFLSSMGIMKTLEPITLVLPLKFQLLLRKTNLKQQTWMIDLRSPKIATKSECSKSFLSSMGFVKNSWTPTLLLTLEFQLLLSYLKTTNLDDWLQISKNRNKVGVGQKLSFFNGHHKELLNNFQMAQIRFLAADHFFYGTLAKGFHLKDWKVITFCLSFWFISVEFSKMAVSCSVLNSFFLFVFIDLSVESICLVVCLCLLSFSSLSLSLSVFLCLCLPVSS